MRALAYKNLQSKCQKKFERRGREEFAENAEENQNSVLLFLRLLRYFCVFCVQELNSGFKTSINPPTRPKPWRND
jgi:hypothetical protein